MLMLPGVFCLRSPSPSIHILWAAQSVPFRLFLVEHRPAGATALLQL